MISSMMLVAVTVAFFGETELGIADNYQPSLNARLARTIFAEKVGGVSTDFFYCEWARSEAKMRLQRNLADKFPPASQYFVFVDRNPQKQLIMVGYYDFATDQIEVIGWDKCSTGNPAHGRDYHFTPTGIFANFPDHMSFRAAGTKNSKGWRGYGRKNCRVWDFGYQATTKPIRKVEQERQIRLLMHATDPDGGEPKLGTPQSKGCVRISAKLNKFLDEHGVIDAEYEAIAKCVISAHPVDWLLLKKRAPFPDAGKYLIIGDSAQ